MPQEHPFSIKLVTAYYLVAAASMVANRGSGAMIIGFPANNWYALLHDLLLVLVLLYTAFGLWRLRAAARRLGVGLQGYFLLNIAVALLNPSSREDFIEVISQTGMSWMTTKICFALTYAVLAAWAIGVLWILAANRQAFLAASGDLRADTSV